ncbi:hypothetical protein DFQ28_005998 [Apophysomyces sp. BC1034]|nr:hypothetical protein DFQ30_000109 [Apophysomyces sp. BC1015]KAG0182406.1 hypothetical protein DFQ29_004209 [Apophysomyces sp. BC1021]KAG0193217.1 hypothetical protein DFQ28_005998 [Apophysomyces sp. BC1034]
MLRTFKLHPRYNSSLNHRLAIPKVQFSSAPTFPFRSSSLKQQWTPANNGSPGELKIRYLVPVLFGLAVSGGAFVAAGYRCVQKQDILRQRLARVRQRTRSFLQDADTLQAELMREQRDMLLEKKRVLVARWQRYVDALGTFRLLPAEVKRGLGMLAQQYVALTEAERTMTGLIALNVVVFGCWQLRRWRPFMSRWFCHHPASGRSVTLLTSCFSHQEFFHLTLNMVGLWSFGKTLHDFLGREQFLALYLSAGVGGNVISHVASLLVRRYRPLMPSLGASGAIYGCVAGTAALYPTASVSIVFLPFIPIQIGYALQALVGFDLLGVLLRWRIFDHYAHLTGVGIGLAYLQYGQQYLWYPLLRKIRTIQNKTRRGGGGENGTIPLIELQPPRWIGNK